MILRRAGLALLALTPVAAVVVAAGAVPPGWGAGAGSQAPAVLVGVPAPDTTLICPGPLRLITEVDGQDVIYDPQFDPAPVDGVTSLRAVTVAPADGTAAGAGRLGPLGGEPDTELVAVGPAGALTTPGGAGGVVVSVEPVDGPAWAAAAVATVTVAGDLRGLAGASCQVPTTDAWLVGGGTELGSGARLVLQNPGATPATVTLELWGPAGPVEQAGSAEFLVPAGSERVVLLEGVAAEQRRLVGHLTAAGGAVTAYLQDSRMRGLVPAGVDLVVPGDAPATTQVVPGLVVAASEVDAEDPALLRLLSPGADTTARITLLGAAGPLDLPDVALVAGEVLDLPLGGLAAGAWTAVVSADAPVVAAGAITRGQPDGPLDRAWVASSAGSAGALAVPAGGAATLVLGAQAAASVDVEAVGADGRVLGSERVTVAAGTTVEVPLTSLAGRTEAAGVVVRGEGVAWAVTLTRLASDGDLVSVLVPVAPPADRADVAVTLRR